MKIRPVGAELIHADRRTDYHEAFRNYVKAPNNEWEKYFSRSSYKIGTLFYDVLMENLFQLA